MTLDDLFQYLKENQSIHVHKANFLIGDIRYSKSKTYFNINDLRQQYGYSSTVIINDDDDETLYSIIVDINQWISSIMNY